MSFSTPFNRHQQQQHSLFNIPLKSHRSKPGNHAKIPKNDVRILLPPSGATIPRFAAPDGDELHVTVAPDVSGIDELQPCPAYPINERFVPTTYVNNNQHDPEFDNLERLPCSYEEVLMLPNVDYYIPSNMEMMEDICTNNKENDLSSSFIVNVSLWNSPNLSKNGVNPFVSFALQRVRGDGSCALSSLVNVLPETSVTSCFDETYPLNFWCSIHDIYKKYKDELSASIQHCCGRNLSVPIPNPTPDGHDAYESAKRRYIYNYKQLLVDSVVLRLLISSYCLHELNKFALSRSDNANSIEDDVRSVDEENAWIYLNTPFEADTLLELFNPFMPSMPIIKVGANVSNDIKAILPLYRDLHQQYPNQPSKLWKGMCKVFYMLYDDTAAQQQKPIFVRIYRAMVKLYAEFNVNSFNSLLIDTPDIGLKKLRKHLPYRCLVSFYYMFCYSYDSAVDTSHVVSMNVPSITAQFKPSSSVPFLPSFSSFFTNSPFHLESSPSLFQSSPSSFQSSSSSFQSSNLQPRGGKSLSPPPTFDFDTFVCKSNVPVFSAAPNSLHTGFVYTSTTELQNMVKWAFPLYKYITVTPQLQFAANPWISVRRYGKQRSVPLKTYHHQTCQNVPIPTEYLNQYPPNIQRCSLINAVVREPPVVVFSNDGQWEIASLRLQPKHPISRREDEYQSNVAAIGRTYQSTKFSDLLNEYKISPVILKPADVVTLATTIVNNMGISSLTESDVLEFILKSLGSDGESFRSITDRPDYSSSPFAYLHAFRYQMQRVSDAGRLILLECNDNGVIDSMKLSPHSTPGTNRGNVNDLVIGQDIDVVYHNCIFYMQANTHADDDDDDNGHQNKSISQACCDCDGHCPWTRNPKTVMWSPKLSSISTAICAPGLVYTKSVSGAGIERDNGNPWRLLVGDEDYNIAIVGVLHYPDGGIIVAMVSNVNVVPLDMYTGPSFDIKNRGATCSSGTETNSAGHTDSTIPVYSYHNGNHYETMYRMSEDGGMVPPYNLII